MGRSARRAAVGGVESFFQERTAVIKTKPWQILQVEESERPGHLRVWIINAEGDMTTIMLKVPRRFYINSYVEKPKHSFYRKVNLHLPRAHPRHHLYEVELDEEVFIAGLRDINIQKFGPTVEGFYESHLPHVFRVVMELGCVCSVRPKERAHDLSVPWNLGQLKKESPKEVPYLSKHPRFVYLYQSAASDQGGRGTFGVYFADTKEARISYAAPFVQEPDAGVISALKKIAAPSNVTVSFERHRTTAEAGRMISSALADFKTKHPGATVVTVQASFPPSELLTLVPSLSDYPRITVASNNQDDQYPAFGWFQHTGVLFLQFALKMPEFFTFAVEMSRYTQVPLCSFGTDYPVFLSDILYARQLHANGHLLWYSKGRHPDLGGNEDEDFSFSEELVNPEICNPTAMQTLSFDVNLSGLAVNTMLCATHIGSLEGEANLFEFDTTEQTMIEKYAQEGEGEGAVDLNSNQQNTLDESIACARPFRILRNMVTDWASDLEGGEGEEDGSRQTSQPRRTVAGLFVQTFYRWLSSPHSKLHDPALHRLVHKLVKKVFLQLIGELKKLGVSVIYANFNKLVLGTDKVRLKDCVSHYQFVRKTLMKKRPLFRFLGFTVSEYWDTLLFKDPFNFIGIPAHDLLPLDREEEDIVPKAVWNLARTLPETIRDHFMVVVMEYIILLYKSKPSSQNLVVHHAAGAGGGGGEEREGDGGHESAIDKRGTSSYSLMTEWQQEREHALSPANKAIVTKLTQRLFNVTNDVKHSLSVAMEGGADVHANPSLQFVKTVCHVLALNPLLNAEFTILKRSLLKVVNAREFAEESQFHDESQSYVLPDVICSFCNLSRDVDLLRDSNLSQRQWRCVSCNHTIDRELVEQRLVETVEKLIVSYQIQDLVCQKCGDVKSTNTRKICPACSGPFVNKSDRSETVAKLRLFKTVAEFHSLESLLYLTEWAITH